MKIWHMSDTHGLHNLIQPQKADVLIHSGDFTNSKEVTRNSVELWNFLDWFRNLDIKHKILVAGNHDMATYNKMVTKSDLLNMGINYLENGGVDIGGLNFWGSPYTPTYGNGWGFQVSRAKSHKIWDWIPNNTDVLITHGPPKGVLDITHDNEKRSRLVQVGDSNLKKRVLKVEPLLHCFGHIHNSDKIKNFGLVNLADETTIYSNGAVVEDGKFNAVLGNGTLIEL